MWKWMATGLVGLLIGGMPSYFGLAKNAITADDVRQIYERESKPTITQTYDQVRELRLQVAELQRQTVAMQARLDLLTKR